MLKFTNSFTNNEEVRRLMLEKIINILEKFLEKYFIQSLIALVITAFGYYITPDDSKILLKLNKEFYIIILFIIIFLIIEFVIYILKKINLRVYFRRQKKEYNDEKIKENIQKNKTIIDSLKPNERKILDIFLKNGNEPIVLRENFYDNRVLENFCNKCEIISDGNIKYINLYNSQQEILSKGSHAYRYKLKFDVYKLLKYMMDSGIGISNFD